MTSTDRLVRTSAPTVRGAAPDPLFTFVRSAALIVVVLWHWVFATVRWDGNGPHSGNPLHLVSGGFVLTWFLQVMPLFFIVGGWASIGSLERAEARGETGWVRKRVARLVKPVLPLVAAVLVAKFALSAWTFGVVLLAVSPLWFLGVYVPLTALTPFLVRAHRRSPGSMLGLTIGVVIALQYVHFVLGVGGLVITLLSFLSVWGTAYQLGFVLEQVRKNRRLAIGSLVVGLAGIIGSGAFGYSLSMVTRVTDARSNMGPPTIQIVFLALFQMGLICVFQNALRRFASRPTVARTVALFDAHQMTIYTTHLPIWVAVLALLRSTPLALTEQATLGWVVARPLWLLAPGVVLFTALRASKSR
jgi:Acyltransferase family